MLFWGWFPWLIITYSLRSAEVSWIMYGPRANHGHLVIPCHPPTSFTWSSREDSGSDGGTMSCGRNSPWSHPIRHCYPGIIVVCPDLFLTCLGYLTIIWSVWTWQHSMPVKQIYVHVVNCRPQNVSSRSLEDISTFRYLNCPKYIPLSWSIRGCHFKKHSQPKVVARAIRYRTVFKSGVLVSRNHDGW